MDEDKHSKICAESDHLTKEQIKQIIDDITLQNPEDETNKEMNKYIYEYCILTEEKRERTERQKIIIEKIKELQKKNSTSGKQYINNDNKKSKNINSEFINKDLDSINDDNFDSSSLNDDNFEEIESKKKKAPKKPPTKLTKAEKIYNNLNANSTENNISDVIIDNPDNDIKNDDTANDTTIIDKKPAKRTYKKKTTKQPITEKHQDTDNNDTNINITINDDLDICHQNNEPVKKKKTKKTSSK